MTGDKKMQAEGKMDKAKGAAHNAVGDAKDTARDANSIASTETQQEGRPDRGGLFDIPRYRSRPVEAIPAWLTAAEISSDPLFSPGSRAAPPVGPVNSLAIMTP